MSAKILLIEKDEEFASLIKLALRAKDREIIVAPDGKTGLVMAFSEFPDLIIVDILLPDEDGLNICRKIKESELQVPILILTVRSEIVGIEANQKIGFDDYLSKPFDIEELRTRVYALLQRSVPIKSSIHQNKPDYVEHYNPYIVGAPVPPDKFYGRQKILYKILTAIKNGNHVAIYGERRIGKTSLLYRLEHLLKDETISVFVPVFIQMQLLSEDDFFGSLIDEVLRVISPPIKALLPTLIRQTTPQSYKVMHLLQDLEMVIQIWKNNAPKLLQVVFLLDEGDRLNKFSEETQMRLRGLLQKPLINQHVRLVWSGVGIDHTWRSDTSPWFNLFKAEFRMGSLEPEEAQSLILEPVVGVYQYGERAITKILELTQSKPYMMQWLCSNCIDNLQEQGRRRGFITLQDVESTWADLQKRIESSQFYTYEPLQPQA